MADQPQDEGRGNQGDVVNEDRNRQADAFNAAARGKRVTLGSEFMGFLSENKKWWLLPILLAVLALGVLVILGGTGAGPFIYTLV